MELSEIREASGPGHRSSVQKIGGLADISMLPAALQQELAGQHCIERRYESIDGTRLLPRNSATSFRPTECSERFACTR